MKGEKEDSVLFESFVSLAKHWFKYGYSKTRALTAAKNGKLKKIGLNVSEVLIVFYYAGLITDLPL